MILEIFTLYYFNVFQQRCCVTGNRLILSVKQFININDNFFNFYLYLTNQDMFRTLLGRSDAIT